MYLQRGPFAALKSLGRAKPSPSSLYALRSRGAVADMVSPKRRTLPKQQQQQQQPQSEEEVVFSGRNSRRNRRKTERMSGRAPAMDSRPPPPPPPPHRTGSTSSNYRGERGAITAGGVALPPRPRTPEIWTNSYPPGGRYEDAGREARGWYEDSRRLGGGDIYRPSGREDVGYRNAERPQPMPERDARHSYPNLSIASGERAPRNIGYGHANSSRSDSYGGHHYNPPPPAGHERGNSHGSYHTASGVNQPYDRYQPPRERANPPPSSQCPGGESNYRYSPPSSAFFSATAAAAANNHPRKLSKKARQRGTANLNRAPSPPPKSRQISTSPALPVIPRSEQVLPTPIPSPSYTAITLLTCPRLNTPTRHLIILDLNGTLLAREKGKARSGSVNPTPRPGLPLFLNYLFANFSVMVWSSAQPENVRLMVHALFSESQKASLLACWGRDTLGLTKAQFSAKTQVYKRLERVWGGEYMVPHHTGEGWDQTNTILLDDSPEKAVGQPWNHVEVPEFSGTAVQKKEDQALWALAGYLEGCRWRGNVSAFIRETPFTVGGGWEAAGREVLREFENDREREEFGAKVTVEGTGGGVKLERGGEGGRW